MWPEPALLLIAPPAVSPFRNRLIQYFSLFPHQLVEVVTLDAICSALDKGGLTGIIAFPTESISQAEILNARASHSQTLPLYFVLDELVGTDAVELMRLGADGVVSAADPERLFDWLEQDQNRLREQTSAPGQEPLNTPDADLQAKYEEEIERQTYLAILQEITVLLAKAETIDEFFEITVHEGIGRLGFDRMGMLLFDEAEEKIIGTYGTDAQGALRDEHYLKVDLDRFDRMYQRALSQPDRIVFAEEVLLYEDDRLLGQGSSAVALMTDGGTRVIGWLSVDNAVHHRPINKVQLEILQLYALTVGALLSRKETEVALRESEARYRFLTDSIEDIIVKFDVSAQIEYVSLSSIRVLGYQPEEVIGLGGFELVHPDDVAKGQATMAAAVEVGLTSFNLEERLRHRDGHYIWFDLAMNILYDPATGAPIELVGVFRNISERKEAEMNLRRLASIQEFMSDGAIGTDLEFNILTWNPAAETMFGWTSEAAIGQNLRTLLKLEILGQPFESAAEKLMQDGYWHGEAVLYHQSGNPRFILASIGLIRDEKGAPVGIIGVNHDISERKSAEEALKATLERERELGRLKSRFVSTASHQFRTPLAVILSGVDTITHYKDRMTEEQIDSRLDRIRGQVNHLTRIVEDLLELSRIQSGRIRFSPAKDDLDLLIRTVLEDLEADSEFRDRIRYRTSDAPLIMTFDAKLMHHVCNNLVHNALKYSGTEPVEVALQREADGVLLTVVDRGIGIPKSARKDLFEPFNRGDNVGTIAGTGLGLSIVKQAVDAHNGAIQVDSRVNEGTSVEVFIPAA